MRSTEPLQVWRMENLQDWPSQVHFQGEEPIPKCQRPCPPAVSAPARNTMVILKILGMWVTPQPHHSSLISANGNTSSLQMHYAVWSKMRNQSPLPLCISALTLLFDQFWCLASLFRWAWLVKACQGYRPLTVWYERNEREAAACSWTHSSSFTHTCLKKYMCMFFVQSCAVSRGGSAFTNHPSYGTYQTFVKNEMN